MKITLYLMCTILVLLGCKKEKVAAPEMVGKWAFFWLAEEYKDGAVRNISASCSDFIYSNEEVGQVELEITEKGEFIFTSKKGTETFQLVKLESRISNAQINTCAQQPDPGIETVLEGYNFTLRNKSGVKFKFPCFYVSDYDVLVTVPWVKGVLYNSTDRVYYEGVGHTPFLHQTTSPLDYYPLFYQYLGNFKRL